MKIKCDIVFKYKDKEYILTHDFGEYSVDGADYMFTEGNYACDCNRCLMIMEKCDKDFPGLKCGNEIKMERFEIKEYN